MKIDKTRKEHDIKKLPRFLMFLFLMPFILLTSCFANNSKLSVHMEFVIRKAYLDEFILPNNPEATIEDVDFYQFVYKSKYKENSAYLFAWDIIEDSDEWSLTIENQIITFEHVVDFIVYDNNSKSFCDVNAAIQLEMFTIIEFVDSLSNLDVFIGTSTI